MVLSVKICGLTDEQSVQTVITAGADYAGFVYFPASPRHIAAQPAAHLRSLLPPSVAAVSVVVDPDDDLLQQLASVMKPDYFQLHGNENPERVRAIKDAFSHVKIIKAIGVRSSDDVAQAMRYTHCADMLMFDAKPLPLPTPLPHAGEGSAIGAGERTYLPGGNGLSFDWALLKNRDFLLPWMLSGGLNGDNVAQAIRQTGAKMVDVSSGVERVPGVKNPALIQAFVKTARDSSRESRDS